MTSACIQGDKFEVRLFNPTLETISATLDFGSSPAASPWQSYCQVNLESQPINDRVPFSGRLEETLAPKKIITLQIV
jgi:hypothetical protein